MPNLLDPIVIGDLKLPNRILMAPLTRNRSSGSGRVPNALMRDYYVQRASAGAIFTEATSVAPAGVGYPHTPGIWSAEQTEGWRLITDGVHQAGGRILLHFGTSAAFPTQVITRGRFRSRRAPSRRRAM
jgi:2,4-dienoyl-CoA reductase-like NADH-dependent reductase (Old Yellow Enzyme family)